MQLLRRLVATALAVMLTSCALNQDREEEGTFASGDGTGRPAPGVTDDTPGQVSYVVPDSSCPGGWTGLEVTTDGDGGIGHLNDVVACTGPNAQRTYLENNSRAVWLLNAATVTRSVVVRDRKGPGESSFLRIVRESRGQEAMAPGSALTANVPPDEISWAPDLPLTFSWEGHALTVAGLQAVDESLATAALERTSSAGDALVACTLSVDRRASAVADLADADAAKVVLAGLDSARCRDAASAAGLPETIGRTPDAAEIEVLTANLRAAAASSRALPKGARLLTP